MKLSPQFGACALQVFWVRGFQQAHQEGVQPLQLQERGGVGNGILVDALCAPAEEGSFGWEGSAHVRV